MDETSKPDEANEGPSTLEPPGKPAGRKRKLVVSNKKRNPSPGVPPEDLASKAPELLGGAPAEAERIFKKDDILVDPPKHNWNDEEAKHQRSEKSKESDHKRSEKEKDADHRRYQEKWVTRFALGIVSVITLLSTHALAVRPQTEVPWAAPLLTLIVGGFVGYLARGKPT